MIILICKNCGKEFKVYPCSNTTKFCSRECFAEARKRGQCPNIGFQKGHSQFNSGKTYFQKGHIPYSKDKKCFQMIGNTNGFQKGHTPWNKDIKSPKITGKNNPSYKHGMTKTKFYKCWAGIIKRCNNSNSTIYEYYGGRGISVCNQWLDFINFRDDMYKNYKEHLTEFGKKDTQIERIDNDGNYCPKNCKWATKQEQMNNRRNFSQARAENYYNS